MKKRLSLHTRNCFLSSFFFSSKNPYVIFPSLRFDNAILKDLDHLKQVSLIQQIDPFRQSNASLRRPLSLAQPLRFYLDVRKGFALFLPPLWRGGMSLAARVRGPFEFFVRCFLCE